MRALPGPVVLLAAVTIAACGSESGGSGAGADAAPKSPPPGAALPPALAANVKQANEIVGEGSEDFRDRLERLRGHPVVVNQWASWCPSCRAEFPFFRAAVARYRDRVAFLGLDSQDNKGDAEDFLKQIPADFPSIFDPNASVAADLGGGQGWPSTFFLDETGEVVKVKIGAYATAELLDEDIRRYALAGV